MHVHADMNRFEQIQIYFAADNETNQTQGQVKFIARTAFVCDDRSMAVGNFTLLSWLGKSERDIHNNKCYLAWWQNLG